jgi:hypothetical protein
MESRRTWRQRLSSAYWWVVGIFGVHGGPIVDRKEMYGSDPANDPYRTGFNPSRKPNDDRDRSD